MKLKIELLADLGPDAPLRSRGHRTAPANHHIKLLADLRGVAQRAAGRLYLLPRKPW